MLYADDMKVETKLTSGAMKSNVRNKGQKREHSRVWGDHAQSILYACIKIMLCKVF